MKTVHPKRLQDVRDAVANLGAGEMIRLESGELTFNTVRITMNQATINLSTTFKRGYMSKKVDESVILARYA